MTNPWLIAGGTMSIGAALLHIAIIFGGPRWYRFFGAGDEIARMAEEGRWRPAIITGLIALGLAVWGLYAYAGAGVLPEFPLQAPVLWAITAIYTMRGLAYPFFKFFKSEFATPFFLWSSLICLVFGLVHGIGLVQVWERL
jgi:hypothetical protein